MLAHKYQIYKKAWGREVDPDSDIEQRLVGITAYAKRDRHNPYEVFNELVAMQLGRLIGLSVPPGMVVEKEGSLYFASMHILETGGSLPDCDFARFCREMRREACGTMVFDAWIANNDRHDENMWFNYYDSEYFLIDHGQSLLGNGGEVFLHSNRDRLHIRTSTPALSEFITSFVDFRHWYDLIKAIPPDSIRRVVNEAAKVGIDHLLANMTADWLIERRARLPRLFSMERGSFPKLIETLIDPFSDSNDTFPEYCI
jgi:hypothetical protein